MVGRREEGREGEKIPDCESEHDSLISWWGGVKLGPEPNSSLSRREALPNEAPSGMSHWQKKGEGGGGGVGATGADVP